MKQIAILFLILLSCVGVSAQITSSNARRTPTGHGAPAGSCTNGPPFGTDYTDIDTTPPTIYKCKSGSWSAVTSGGAAGTVTTTGSPASPQLAKFSSATAITTATATDVSTPSQCADAGANDTYACNLAPAIASYVVGTKLRFFANTANTGAASINFNSVGALTIVKMAGGITTTLADNDIRAGQWVDGIIATGSNFQMTSQVGNAASAGVTGTGTLNTIPKITNATGPVIGDTTFADNGSQASITNPFYVGTTPTDFGYGLNAFPFNIKASAANTVMVVESNTGASLMTLAATAGRFTFATDFNSGGHPDVYFSTPGHVNELVIANNGNVGVNNPSPAVALDVTGAVAASGALTLPGLGTSSAATTGTLCWTTGTGNVNVDTTTTCLLSSARFKERSRPLLSGLDTILRLRPVSYFLKPQYNPTGLGEQVGLLAEDVAKVDSRLVSFEKDGSPHAVRYQQLTAELTLAIQELNAKVEQLSRQVARQQRTIRRMRHPFYSPLAARAEARSVGVIGDLRSRLHLPRRNHTSHRLRSSEPHACIY